MLRDLPESAGQPRSFGLRLLESCAANRTNVAIRTARQELSYERLHRALVNYALRLREHGIGRQSLVMVHTKPEHGLVTLVIRLALALVGAPWTNYRSYKIGAKPWTHVLSTDEAPELAYNPVIRVDGSWNALSVEEIARQSPVFEGYGPKDVVYFAETSGTTGQPRLVMRLLPEIEKQLLSRQPVARSMTSLFPYSAERSFWRTVTMLLNGGTLIERPSFDVAERRPELVVGSNSQIDAWLGGAGAPPPGIKRLPLLFPMGSLVSARDIGHYLQFFEKVMVPYAGTEMGRVGTATITDALAAPYVAYDLEEDAEVEIVDDDDRPVPPGTEGLIRVQTSRVKQLRALGDRVTVAANGWFYPGDRGIITGERRLMVTGRVSDVLNIRGVKADGAEMDRVIRTIDGVADAAVFELVQADSHARLAALIVPKANGEGAELASLVRSRFNTLRHFPALDSIFLVPSLPMNDNGKVVRRLCAEAARDLPPL
jgi:acyl-coenzyme A synthetase/AMP-(fatty) acid ligase